MDYLQDQTELIFLSKNPLKKEDKRVNKIKSQWCIKIRQPKEMCVYIYMGRGEVGDECSSISLGLTILDYP